MNSHFTSIEAARGVLFTSLVIDRLSKTVLEGLVISPVMTVTANIGKFRHMVGDTTNALSIPLTWMCDRDHGEVYNIYNQAHIQCCKYTLT